MSISTAWTTRLVVSGLLAATTPSAAETKTREVVAGKQYEASPIWSFFFGEDYLIKGVAGSILNALLSDYVQHGRVAFTNRELRLDRRIRLPDLSDNLEARLILLARRLEERRACVRIQKTGRGRFELKIDRPVRLVELA